MNLTAEQETELIEKIKFKNRIAITMTLLGFLTFIFGILAGLFFSKLFVAAIGITGGFILSVVSYEYFKRKSHTLDLIERSERNRN